MEGNSVLWVILRTKEKYNPFSSVLKFTKSKERSQNCFIAMGTFIMDNNNLIFKEFQSQQLIQIGTGIIASLKIKRS